jgi:uncharacterized membrane protein YkgB
MNTQVETRSLPASLLSPTRARALEAGGLQALRYGLVLVLVLFGATKFTAAEAAAIQPLVANSPLMSWLYSLLSVEGASRLIGSVELVTAGLVASRPFSARASALGSALAAGTFLATLSFLLSTPGALSASHPAHGFLLKDIVLLGAALAIGTEALRAALAPSEGA